MSTVLVPSHFPNGEVEHNHASLAHHRLHLPLRRYHPDNNYTNHHSDWAPFTRDRPFSGPSHVGVAWGLVKGHGVLTPQLPDPGTATMALADLAFLELDRGVNLPLSPHNWGRRQEMRSHCHPEHGDTDQWRVTMGELWPAARSSPSSKLLSATLEHLLGTNDWGKLHSMPRLG